MSARKLKIIRAATVGISLDTFCKGVLSELKELGYEVVALSSPDEGLLATGDREGVRTIGVPMERRVSPWKDLVSLMRLIRVMRRERPAMVHSMTPKAGLLVMMAAWIARVPLRVHTFTGLVWPTARGLQRHILKMTDRLTCACATHIVPEGYGVMDDLRNGGITRKPMAVLGYGNVRGVDLDYYSRRPEVMARAAEIADPDVMRLTFVGRIVGDKGINELVTAFLALRDKNRAEGTVSKMLRLTLIGRYEDLDPISPETKLRIESDPDIEAVGPKYGDDLLAWYAASDCFVFPSYREGFPNTVIEAGALGLPSIVTDINGSREIVVSYDHDAEHATGLIVAPRDANALQQAMEWMLTHQAERCAMCENAKRRVAERFEQGFVRQCLYAFYAEKLKSIVPDGH